MTKATPQELEALADKIEGMFALGICSRDIEDKHFPVLNALIAKAVTSVLDEELPRALEAVIAEKLMRNPRCALSNAGFGWALSISLRKHWPDVDGEIAAKWLWDYIGVPFGTVGYNWSYAAAQAVAAQYVEEYGEPRP